jgi:hypothetical protein
LAWLTEPIFIRKLRHEATTITVQNIKSTQYQNGGVPRTTPRYIESRFD